MEGSQPLLQFGQEADTDEPLLQLGGSGKDKGADDDDEPLLKLNQKEKDTESTEHEDEPMVQHISLEDDDGDTEEPSVLMMKQRQYTFANSGFLMKIVLIFLAVVAAIAVIAALLGLVLSAAGLQKAPPTLAPASMPSTSGSSNSKPTTPPNYQLVSKSECGSGQWMQVAYFDMSDPAQQCPRGWRGYDNPVRCCGRPASARSSSPSVYYSTNGFQYSKVCGTAIGYQVGSPDCFSSVNNAEPDHETVNGIYIDGVSVTHGNPRTHIWTFAIGLHERSGGNDIHNCPCDGGASPPDFVGNNYFCETGDDTPNVELTRFYDDDPLWDGSDCHNATCCAYNHPPWFHVQLDSPTTDDIEVRICGDQSTGDEDSPIKLLEIYVQQ